MLSYAEKPVSRLDSRGLVVLLLFLNMIHFGEEMVNHTFAPSCVTVTPINRIITFRLALFAFLTNVYILCLCVASP